jgi:predicted nucleic acid-binding protein
MIEKRALKPVYCENIIKEYVSVLNRPRFGFPSKIVNGMLDLFDLYGITVEPTKSTFPMADESDRIFYDVAIAAAATLITGNGKHFPADPQVMSPAEFVVRLLE